MDYTGVIDGAPGRICTGTGPGLSRLPLLLGYGSETKSPRQGSHLHFLRSKRSASSVGLHGEESGTPGRNFACNLRVRSAALYTLSYGSIENGAPGRFRPVCLLSVSEAIYY